LRKIYFLIIILLLLLFGYAFSFPILISPRNNAILETNEILFVWHNEDLANVRYTYHFELSNKKNFTNIIDSIHTDKMEEKLLLEPGEYFWKVSRISNNKKMESTVSRFEVSYKERTRDEWNEHLQRERQEASEKINLLNETILTRQEDITQLKEKIILLESQNELFKNRANEYLTDLQNLRSRITILANENRDLRNNNLEYIENNLSLETKI
jgi:hypothetical protein